MLGEDYRSQAVLSFRRVLKTEMSLEEAQESLTTATQALQEKSEQLDDMIRHVDINKMEKEDHVCQIFYKDEEVTKLRAEAAEHAE